MTWPQYLRRECAVDNVVVKLGGRLMTEMLSSILLQHPRPVTSSELIEMVWPDPDFEPDFARNIIYVTMPRLMKKLGEQHFTSRVYLGYSLNQ